MEVDYAPDKRLLVLAERGLDIAGAGRVFDRFHLTRPDAAHSGVEMRFISVGELDGEVVLVVWTHRGDRRRIVTMWKCNERERQAFYREHARRG